MEKWRKWKNFITVCADDFTESARGELGGWSGLFFSGAMKKVVIGINVEALCAVIGDGLDVIIRDVRPAPSWMTSSFEVVDSGFSGGIRLVQKDNEMGSKANGLD